MQTPPNGLSDAVLRLVLYFDLFRHPLTLGELERLAAPGRPAEVERALVELGRRRLVVSRGRHWVRWGAEGDVALRQRRSRSAEEKWPAARRAAGVLAGLPFVRAVLITGSMSKNSTDARGDVDFMLLVQPGRVWMLKSMLQAVRRSLPGPLRELFCTNYLLSADSLLIDDRNMFTAVELATAVPMAGPELCVELLERNAWAETWVPGLGWSLARAANAPVLSPSAWARAVEEAAAGPGGGAVEHRALEAWRRYWDRKYDWLTPADRDQRFKRREQVATNHLHDFQDYVLGEVCRRMEAVGLGDPPGSRDLVLVEEG